VNNVDGAAIVAYVNGAGASATASWPNATLILNAPAPDVASFSSRGPSLAGGGDILKPDFMAPGQDIVAAVAPPGNAGKDFDVYSGTSMSSPHVAGIAALLTQAHRNWSPAAMRSAIATTADATSRAGLNAPFNTGSGHVRPNLATDPGLVYDASYLDYLSFLQGQDCQCLPASIPAIDASDLNQPSIAIGDLAGSQTVTRKVTNLGSAATYNVNLAGAPAGFTIAVNPTSLTLAAGETKSYTVAITRTTATLGSYAFGSLTWSDGSHSVRSPIIVRPVALAAPAQLNLSGTSGSTTFSVKTGYSGVLNTAVRGLIPATTTAGHVDDDPANSFSPTGKGITTHPLVIPAGTTYARISLFDEFTDGEDDLDLYVYDSGGTQVGASGGGTAAEEVNLVNPAAGTYTVYVHGWETDGPDANYTLFTWVLGSTDAGNATISPASTAAGVGTPISLTLNWSGLAAATKYLGSLAYNDGTNSVGRTIVRVDTP
jgi:hypothetical protein